MKKYMIGSAVLAVVFSFGFYEYSKAGGDEITICVKKNGLVYVIGENFKRTDCTKNDSILSWNAAGKEGQRGEPGKDGTMTLPDAKCWGNDTRYVDCGNGTVTDQQTGLIWLKQSDCLPFATFAGANKAAQKLKDGDCGLTDASIAGQWRLPTKDEWAATTADARRLGCTFPGFTNDASTGCYTTGPSSFPNVETTIYWSSTYKDHQTEGIPPSAWNIHFNAGDITDGYITSTLMRPWPVRK